MELRFHPDAERELEEGGAELGDDFVEAVEATLERALSTPVAGALWPRVPPDLNVRRRDLRQFEYRSIAYTVVGDTMWVVALVHERRRPGYWVDRVRDLQP